MAKVLLYNLSGKDKLTRLRFLFFKLGIEGREVSPAEFDLPIGALVGLEGQENAAADEGEDFSDEMLVLCGLSSPQFNALLAGMRQNHATVALKAVLTETNAAWSSRRLHRELAAEHEAMQKLKPKDAAKHSRHHQ